MADDTPMVDADVGDQLSYLQLDEAAQAALNLFPDKDIRDPSASLYGLLNHGRTAMSRARLREWIKKPLVDPAQIARRQNYVEMFLADSDLFTQMFDVHLKRMPDIESALKKLVAAKGDSADQIKTLLILYQVVQRFPVLVQQLAAHQGPHAEMVQAEIVHPATCEGGIIDDVGVYARMIEETIDLRASEKHEYRVLPTYDEKLAAATSKIDRVKHDMNEVRQDIAGQLDLDEGRVKLTTSTTHACWCLRVTRKDESALRGQSRYSTLESKKDGVYFTSSELRALNAKWNELNALIRGLQQTIVAEAVQVAMSYLPNFRRMGDIITELDVLLGFAHAAMHAPTAYVRPEVLPLGSGVLELLDARHPCVEQTHTCRAANFIPNDVRMYKDSARTQIVTGPNMGGKSTYIRMVGVLVVMAQLGSFIPCSSARVSVQSTILARVGAGDNQTKGMSTFMAEMIEASTIVKQANENALVIIDELGRGTSTYDGFGLAWSISEHLTKETQCFTLFATHFAELPALATEYPRAVRNLYVTAHTDASSITMLYRVQEGVSDRSFGVHVAQVANFPPEVVAMARDKAKELEQFSGSIESILQPAASSASAAGAGDVSCSPPDSQGVTPSPAAASSVHGVLGGSNRVQSTPSHSLGAIVDSDPVLHEVLLAAPMAHFKNVAGVVDRTAMRQWVKDMRDKRRQGAAMHTTPKDQAPVKVWLADAKQSAAANGPTPMES